MAEVYFKPPATATPLDRQALRDAWIALLGRWEWEWFCTNRLRVFRIANTGRLGRGVGQERW